MNKLWQKKTLHYVAAFGGGFSSTTNLGSNQTFPTLNPTTDEYYSYNISKGSQLEGLLEAFLGAEQSFYHHWLIQYGVAYAQAGYFNPQGNFIQGADIASQNEYSYQFRLMTRQLLAQAKLIYPYQNIFLPYFLAGIGSSINTASDYSTTDPPFLTFTRMYENHQPTSFAFRVGAGADLWLLDDWRVGIAYRFANLGSFSLGNTSINNITVSGTLAQSKVYANEFLVQLSYII